MQPQESEQESEQGSEQVSKPWYVYCLQCQDGNTYIGATVDLNRRLRQHNKELQGGARRTSAKVIQGQSWKRMLYVSGFDNNIHALQFEWRWKFISRKLSGGSALERRIRALPETILKHPGNLQINAENSCPGEHILNLQVQLATAGLETPVTPSPTHTA